MTSTVSPSEPDPQCLSCCLHLQPAALRSSQTGIKPSMASDAGWGGLVHHCTNQASIGRITENPNKANSILAYRSSSRSENQDINKGNRSAFALMLPMAVTAIQPPHLRVNYHWMKTQHSHPLEIAEAPETHLGALRTYQRKAEPSSHLQLYINRMNATKKVEKSFMGHP